MTKQKQTYVGVVGYADSDFSFVLMHSATLSFPTREEATSAAIALRNRLSDTREVQDKLASDDNDYVSLEWALLPQVQA